MAIDGDVVLFFEGMVDAPGITESALLHLSAMGVFEHVRGVVVGADGSPLFAHPPEVPFSRILADVTADHQFPIIECDDFGHGGVNTVLPVGATARVEADRSQLVITEPFLADQ